MRKVLFGLTTAAMLLGTIACTNNDDIVKDFLEVLRFP